MRLIRRIRQHACQKKLHIIFGGAAGRGDEGTKTGTLLHFSKGSLPKLLEIALGFLRQEVAKKFGAVFVSSRFVVVLVPLCNLIALHETSHLSRRRSPREPDGSRSRGPGSWTINFLFLWKGED
jgi:hypothetical protein